MNIENPLRDLFGGIWPWTFYSASMVKLLCSIVLGFSGCQLVFSYFSEKLKGRYEARKQGKKEGACAEFKKEKKTLNILIKFEMEV